MTRAPRALLVGLLVVAVVAALLVWWTREPYVTDLDGLDRGAGAEVAPGLAARSLTRLTDAVRTGDPAAARALAPPDDPAAGEQLAAVVDNAKALRVTGFDLRYLDQQAPVEGAGAGEWTAAVEVTWRYDGFADVDARVETPVSFVRDGERVAISGVGGPPAADAVPLGLPGTVGAPRDSSRTPTWLAGPVDVRRTRDTLVLVARGATQRALDADAYADLARSAVAPVAAAVDAWDRRLVVEVPAGTDGLAAALGAPVADVAGVAAVTASPDGELGRGGAVDVYVNPDVYDGLGRRGAQLVMTHEAVHVATRAPASRAPIWLVEGFADVVAVRDAGVAEPVAAAQIAAQVRRRGVPDALPGPEQFDTTTGRAGPTYESAWVACLVLADAAGDEGLRRIYARTDDGEDVGTVVRQEAGIGLADLTRRWQDRLEALAARSAA